MMAGSRRAFFREPRAGNMAGVGAVTGCLMVVDGFFFSDYPSIGGPSYSPALVALGSMFALQFAAELLPKSWSAAAGILRTGAVCVAVASLLLILIP